MTRTGQTLLGSMLPGRGRAWCDQWQAVEPQDPLQPQSNSMPLPVGKAVRQEVAFVLRLIVRSIAVLMRGSPNSKCVLFG